MKKQFSHGTPQQMLDVVNNKITELENQSVDSATRINAATGSVDEMIDAVNARINELSGHQNSVNSAEYIPSDKEELILPEDYETIYLDSQYSFGDGGELSLAQIKEYWNGNYNYDPSLAMYDSFDAWWEDTKKWLSPVSSSTNVDSVESASYFFDDEDNEDGTNYIHTLIGYIHSELNNKVENLSVEESEEELNIVVTTGGTVLEFTVPIADLTCKFETINEDVKYIVDAIEKDINGFDDEDDIYSSTSIKANSYDAAKIQKYINNYGFNDYVVYDRDEDWCAIDFEGEDEDDVIPLVNRIKAIIPETSIFEHYIEMYVGAATAIKAADDAVNCSTVADNGEQVFQLMEYDSDPEAGIEGDNFYCYGEFFATDEDDALKQLEEAKSAYPDFASLADQASLFVQPYNEHFSTGQEIYQNVSAIAQHFNQDFHDEEIPFA